MRIRIFYFLNPMSDIAGRCRQFAAAPCGGLHFAPARALPAAGGEPPVR